MAYYYEFFIEDDNKNIVHVGSCNGSYTPSNFMDGDVKNLKDWNDKLEWIKDNNGFYPHNEHKHPFPWDEYETSDGLIVLKKYRKYFFELWKPKYQVYISIKFWYEEPPKILFINAKKWGGDIEYNSKDLIKINIPKLIKPTEWK